MDHSDRRDFDTAVSSSFAEDSISEAGLATDRPCPSNQHNDTTSAMLGTAFQVSFRFVLFHMCRF